MKRWFSLFLTLLLLFSGCTKTPSDVTAEGSSSAVTSEADCSAASSEPTEMVPSSAPETGAYDRETPLFLGRQSLDETGALFSIPNETLESLNYPNFRMWGEDFLFMETEYPDPESCRLTLKRVDGSDGSLLQERSFDVKGYCVPQILGDRLALCDSITGEILVLDRNLLTISQNSAPADACSWYLSTDEQTLYRIDSLNGITAVHLSDGSIQTRLKPLGDLYVEGASEDAVFLSWLDSETELYSWGKLDLTTGRIVPSPFDADLAQTSSFGNQWLASLYGDFNRYLIGDSDSRSVRSFSVDYGYFFLTQKQHLLLRQSSPDDYVDCRLTLYDADGTFLSETPLTVNGTDAYLESDFYWSEQYGGYFFTVSDTEGSINLLFWDLSAEMSGEDLTMTAFSGTEAVSPGTSADPSLYERAAALSEKYGIEIRIADQCETVYPDFETYPVSDFDAVSSALDVLDFALSRYPEGFFRQLRYGHFRSAQFNLVGGLTARNGFGGDLSYAAFTIEGEGCLQVVADISMTGPDTYYHEISHMIDRKLAFDAFCREGALFSEERWLALCPSDFAYREEYGSPETSIWGTSLENYFIDDYACIRATEDRARILEYAMGGYDWPFEAAPLRAKLQYYCDCIRDGFDTTGWPAVLPWEEPLKK